MEIKKYKFQCGKEAEQAPCTYKQGKEILSLLKKVNLNFGDLTKIPIIEIMEKIAEEDLLLTLFSIILGQEDWSILTLDEIAEVVTDFFTLNPGLVKLFGIGKSGAGSQ